jgi:hypothetical protein
MSDTRASSLAPKPNRLPVPICPKFPICLGSYQAVWLLPPELLSDPHPSPAPVFCPPGVPFPAQSILNAVALSVVMPCLLNSPSFTVCRHTAKCCRAPSHSGEGGIADFLESEGRFLK